MQVWAFSEWVRQQLDPEMEELARMPSPRIAFHIRGGDKLSEDVQLVSLSLHAGVLVSHRLGTSSKASDQTAFLLVLQSRLTTQPADFIQALQQAHPGIKVCIYL